MDITDKAGERSARCKEMFAAIAASAGGWTRDQMPARTADPVPGVDTCIRRSGFRTGGPWRWRTTSLDDVERCRHTERLAIDLDGRENGVRTEWGNAAKGHTENCHSVRTPF